MIFTHPIAGKELLKYTLITRGRKFTTQNMYISVESII